MTLPLYIGPLLCLVGAFLVGLVPWKNEKRVHQIALLVSTLFVVVSLVQVGGWLGGTSLPFRETIFRWGSYSFEFSLAMDRIAAVFFFVTAVLGALVIRFSQFYMHREPGQQRFFATLLVFLGGMAVVVLAGDMATLFSGWELVGMGSFLLIGFYRHREYPVRNALKVYSIYRVCDVGLLIAAYEGHRLYGTANFAEQGLQTLSSQAALPISLLILLSAAGKSGQFPFSFWVARAMEGPTPSSAIFYGAISIHVGVFLLLRTAPIWEVSELARLAIVLVGLFTAVLTTIVGHVQSNIKGRIGYASVAQVGLMFVEVALGLETLALLHFVGNASLRCYQLLVSPSVVAYILRLQSSASERGRPGPDRSVEARLFPKLRATVYVCATQEFFMEYLVNRVFLAVPQWTARHIMAENSTILNVWTRGLIWNAILVAGVGWASDDYLPGLPFVIGILISYLVGVVGILLLPRRLRLQSLDHLEGLSAHHSMSARLVFLSFLGMSGFPITPAFWGADILLTECMQIGLPVALLFSGTFFLNGIVLARTFTRLYLGPASPTPCAVPGSSAG